jgi:hypothetical protein
VAPPVVGRQQLGERGEQVVVGAASELEYGDPGGGVRDEDVQQPVLPGCHLAEPPGDLGREVMHPLARAGPDIDDDGLHSSAPGYRSVEVTYRASMARMCVRQQASARSEA